MPSLRHPRSPVGVFDSGLGGLSVLREMRALLPNEEMLYIADSAWCPYGGRSPEVIAERSSHLTEGLLEMGAKLVVVACNTATIAAVEHLRATYPVRFVGMEPAIKPAVAATKRGLIGVLATGAALSGQKFLKLVETHAGGVRVITRPCPGLVERVEAGDLDGPETRALAGRYVAPLLAAGVDVIVLGCTHYPFLRPLIAELAGPEITLVDTGAAVARQVARVLESDGLRNENPAPGAVRILTTGETGVLDRVLPALVPGWAASVERLVC